MMPALDDASVPRLARGVKLREDKARGVWILNAPERVVMLDEIAAAILRRVDGTRTVAALAADLAGAYAAPVDEIRADVLELLSGLAAKGYVSA